MSKNHHMSYYKEIFTLPLSAITLLAGFIMAESAEIGRLVGLALSFISTITTCAVSLTFSRTQMNLSDSMVRVLNEMELLLMPMFRSCKQEMKMETFYQ